MRAVVVVVVLLACLALGALSSKAATHPQKCKSVQSCRSEIAHLKKAVEWQRQRAVIRAWPGDAAGAIILACHTERVACAGFNTLAFCESRLNPLAGNGQYLGLFQLSVRHRSDPIIRLLGWRSAYAQALHTVRYVKAHGWGEWQCRPDGGLRW